MKDKLWFCGSVRAQAAEQTLAGIYYNLTPTGHAYTPDLDAAGRQPRAEPEREPAAHVAGVAEEQDQPAASEREPAAAVLRLLARPADERARGDLLVEVGADVSVAGELELAGHRASCCSRPACSTTTRTIRRSRSRTTLPNQVAYSDSGTGFSWGNYGNTYGHNASHNFNTRFAASYVTGSHAFKAGVTFMHLWALDLVRRRQQRHDAAAAERRAAAGDGVRDAVFVLRDPQPELGPVRAGSVDAQAGDDQRRRAVRLSQRRRAGADARTRPAGADAQCLVRRGDGRADAGRTSRRGSASPTMCSATARPR